MWPDRFSASASVAVSPDGQTGMLTLAYMWTAGAGRLAQWRPMRMARVAGWKAVPGEWAGPCVWNQGAKGQLHTYLAGGSDTVGVRLDADMSYPDGTWFMGSLTCPVIRA